MIYSPYVTLDVCTTKSFWVVTIVDRAQSQLTMGKKLKKPKKVVHKIDPETGKRLRKSAETKRVEAQADFLQAAPEEIPVVTRLAPVVNTPDDIKFLQIKDKFLTPKLEEDCDFLGLRQRNFFESQVLRTGGYTELKDFPQDTDTQLTDASGEVWAHVRGAVARTFSVNTAQALKAVEQMPLRSATNIGQKRVTHSGAGFAGDQGLRYRYTETADGLHGKLGVARHNQKTSTEEQYRSIKHNLQPACGAATRGAMPWLREELCEKVRFWNSVTQQTGSASVAHQAVTVGFMFGAGAHWDAHDASTAIWLALGEVHIGFPERETIVVLRDGDVITFDARKVMHCCIKRNPLLGKYAVLSLWNDAGHEKQFRSAAHRRDPTNPLFIPSPARRGSKESAASHSNTEADRLVVYALAMNSGCEADVVRLNNLKRKEELLGHTCEVITVSESDNPAREESKIDGHLEQNFTTTRGVKPFLTSIALKRSEFPNARIEVYLDFFWLQRGYYEIRYGKHWPETALQLIAAGANLVVLPQDIGGDMETMLLNSPPVPDHIAVDFTCDSRLLEASKDDEVQDRLIELGRGNLATQLQRLDEDDYFVQYAFDLRMLAVAETTLSDYEKRRVANVARNAAFLASLDLPS